MFDQDEYFNGKKIVARECRFATYVAPPSYSDPDLHVIKEILHLEDNTKVPNMRLEWDYKRPFWVVKKGQRNYKQYLDYIEEDRCNKYFSTQTKLVENIGRALNEKVNPWTDLRTVCSNPYIFGADIKSTSCIKQEYKKAYPNINTEFSVAVFDIETSMFDEEGTAIMATLSFKDKVLTVVRKSFVEGILDVEKKLRFLLKKYLGEIIEQRKATVEFIFVDSEIETFAKCFERAHELSPDFVSVWNQKFDIGKKFIEACERADIDPALIISDPAIPDEYKFFRFKLGPSQKKTAKGLIMPIRPAAQWHTAFFPASFYIMDSMCAYNHTRIGKQEEPSYELDAILKKNGLGGKLRFEEADDYTEGAWHEFMQKNYPLEYIIYNIYDCIGVEMLDEKVKDLAVVISQFSGTSDFEDFKSQPRRKCDEMHWYLLENKMVIGTTNKELSGPLDKLVLGRNDWIITLANAFTLDAGVKIIKENPNQVTSISLHNGDLDVRASYPSGGDAFNIGRRTTKREMIVDGIESINEHEMRMQNMGLNAGHVNSLEYTISMCNAPKPYEVLELYKLDKINTEMSQGIYIN